VKGVLRNAVPRFVMMTFLRWSGRGAALRDGCATRRRLTELIPPNSVFEPRLRQVDFRFSRIFWLRGTTRLRGNLDSYNVFNASNVLGMTTTYGPAWRNVAHTRGPHHALCARWGGF
jgi:hypothetical protein